MALADFNKSNPFIIQMRHNSDRLNDMILNLSKRFIILFVVYMPTSVLLHYALKWGFIENLFLMTPLIILTISLIYIVKHADNKRINEIIYGDRYKDIFANNEEIYDIVCLTRELIGRVNVLKEIVIMFIISYLILDAIAILIIFAKLLYF